MSVKGKNTYTKQNTAKEKVKPRKSNARQNKSCQATCKNET
jgi:hypothetical protein